MPKRIMLAILLHCLIVPVTEENQGYVPVFIFLSFLRNDTSISLAIPIRKLAEETLEEAGRDARTEKRCNSIWSH